MLAYLFSTQEVKVKILHSAPNFLTGRIMNTRQKGDIAELQVAVRGRELGYNVSTSFGNNPFDLIFTDPKSGKCYKIQCKYVTKTNEHYEVDTRRSRGGRLRSSVSRKYKSSDVDVYGVYLSNEKEVIFIPYNKKNHKFHIRTDKDKNNKQASRMSFISEYKKFPK